MAEAAEATQVGKQIDDGLEEVSGIFYRFVTHFDSFRKLSV